MHEACTVLYLVISYNIIKLQKCFHNNCNHARLIALVYVEMSIMVIVEVHTI